MYNDGIFTDITAPLSEGIVLGQQINKMFSTG